MNAKGAMGLGPSPGAKLAPLMSKDVVASLEYSRVVASLAMGPWHPLFGGGEYSREEGSYGVAPPWPP